MNWSKVKLRDIVKIKGGGTPRRENPEFYNGNIPWATIKDLSDKIYLSDTQEYINEEAIKLSASNLIPAGNIILATRMGLGKVVINTVDVAINQDLKALFCSKVIYPKYLLYYLKSIANSIEKQGVGATVKGITVKQVENWDIPLPPLSEQKRIVEILDLADELRKQRAEADALSERILPALFIKMFGDPATNPMGWELVTVESLFPSDRPGTKCGPFGSALKREEYVDQGIPVWGIDNIQPNQFIESGSLFITKEKYKELENYSVIPGDILVSRAGTVGKICVCRTQIFPSIIGTNLIRISLENKKIIPEYFTSLISYFPDIINRLRASSDKTAYSFINTTVIKSLRIPLPSLSLQVQYLQQMQQINNLKIERKKSENHLNKLFQNLLYRAFSGDLTAQWREAHMTELLQEMEHQAKALNLQPSLF